MQPKYKRVLLKLSGESLVGGKEHGIDFDTVLEICAPIKAYADLGVQVGVVVGGSSFWRGRSSRKVDRTRTDHMGMLMTVIDALGMADALEQLGVPVRVQTAITMQQVAELYIHNRAVHHLEERRVAVFGCGTGNPFFSADTAASLCTAEIDAGIIMKAILVDGAYDSDSRLNETAVEFDSLLFMDVLNKDLRVMDSIAVTLCKDNDVPIPVFSIADPENILRIVCGGPIGTLAK